MSSVSVPVREFKARLSRYLAMARSGRIIEITSHRKPIARVQGVPPADSGGIARMVASGEATWNGGKPKGGDFKLSAGRRSLSDMVLDDRG